MSLHQRSQQMMIMMNQAAMQAKAESVAGSAIGGGGAGGSMIGGERGGPRGNLHGASMSMSNLGQFASYGNGSPQQQQQFNPNARLPPFAPPFAMSAPFMHPGIPTHQHSGSLYQMPAYAGSAIGFSPSMQFGGGSVVGTPTNAGGRKGLNPGGRASSMMGFGQR